MGKFYFCTEENCNKKYATKKRIIDHLQKCHDIENPNVGEPQENVNNKTKLFYLCTELDCNRKYARKESLIVHLMECHEIINPEIGEPCEITRENKKTVETNRNALRKKELLERRMQELKEKKQLQDQAKKDAEENYKREQLEKFRLLEMNKLQQEEEKLALENKWITLVKKVHERVEENSDDCSICFDKRSDTAVIPCGHKNFCIDCISVYHASYPSQGCPICRGRIEKFVKIFS